MTNATDCPTTTTRTFDWSTGAWVATAHSVPTDADPTDNATAVPVDVSILLDRSGSMRGLEGDVVGGINAFFGDQRNGEGECTVTLAQFDSDDPYEVLATARPIDQVADLAVDQYRPRGMTPLLDAIGALLDDTERRLGDGPANGTVDPVVVVFTDGHENASRRLTRAELFGRIEGLKANGWTFVFLGANQDAYGEAGGLGFDGTNTQNFRGDAQGMRTASADISRGLTSMRGKTGRDRLMHKHDYFDGLKDAERDDDSR
ncbi:MAG: VWA domain-containing protein [Actinobacteria bacterium]|nr:VWA domain-containing protein [Actinomycetota bacterium]